MFDLGSTLLRFRGDRESVLTGMAKAGIKALKELGCSFEGQDFGKTFRQVFEAAYEARGQDHIERTSRSLMEEVLLKLELQDLPREELEWVLDQMYKVSEEHWHPMPALKTVLGTIQSRGYRLGLITNASDERNVRRLLEQADIGHYFDPIIISAEMGYRKPNHQLFDRVEREWELDPTQLVMVGDQLEADILGAGRAGWHTIWLRSDHQDSRLDGAGEELRPDRVVDRLEQVPQAVESIFIREST